MNLNRYARTNISSSKNNFHFIQLYVQITYRYTLFIQQNLYLNLSKRINRYLKA